MSPSPRCYLCGGKLTATHASRWRLGTEQMRHRKCYDKLAKAARTPQIQEFLRARREPTYSGADDEVEQREREIWVDVLHCFVAAMSNNRLAALPPELLARVGDFCVESKLSHTLCLRSTLVFAEHLNAPLPRPSYEEDLPLGLNTTLQIFRQNVGHRQYITRIKTASSVDVATSAWFDITSVGNETDWTHLVFTLDVSGCRSVAMLPQAKPELGVGVWVRTIPRSAISAAMPFVCYYKGARLRDVRPKEGFAPLFDTVPSGEDLVWFSEARSSKKPAETTPRMMQRRIPSKMSGITVAFMEGSVVDLHLHSGDSIQDERFYEQMTTFHPPPVLRHARLSPDEYITEARVRLRRTWLGYSSACLLFSTSRGRLIDLAPFIPTDRRADHYIEQILKTPGRLHALYLNKRLDMSTNANIALEASNADVVAVDEWLLKTTSSRNDVPSILPNPYVSVFRDSIVLQAEVDVWESVEDSYRVCSGIRARDTIAGQWKESGAPCNKRCDLRGWYLVNLWRNGRCNVCIVSDLDEFPDQRTLPLHLGSHITWWTGEHGNFVQLKEHDI